MTSPTVASTEVKLSDSQQAAKNLLMSGRNVFVTGQAGSGKSFLIEHIAKTMPGVALTASTGLAALNIGGSTIHKWSGIGICRDTPEVSAFKILRSNWAAGMRNAIQNSELLIIDEISMISDVTLHHLNQVLKIIRSNPQPFGGLRVAVFGDFLQLPPVSKNGETFCFKGSAWAEGDFKYIELKTVFRQGVGPFRDALKRIRLGAQTPEDIELLRGRVGKPFPPNLKPACLFPTNVEVDSLNMRELAKVSGPTHSYQATDVIGEPVSISDGQKAYLEDSLNKDCLAPRTLILKVGARVMLVKNMTERLVNGSMGVVVEVDETEIRVQFDDHPHPVWLGKATWEIKNGETVEASRSQIPIKLAWALSIHKSQGQSLDSVFMDCLKMFEKGQAYVGLSRCKTLEGLYLENFNPEVIMPHPDAIKFYQQQENTP